MVLILLCQIPFRVESSPTHMPMPLSTSSIEASTEANPLLLMNLSLLPPQSLWFINLILTEYKSFCQFHLLICIQCKQGPRVVYLRRMRWSLQFMKIGVLIMPKLNLLPIDKPKVFSMDSSHERRTCNFRLSRYIISCSSSC